MRKQLKEELSEWIKDRGLWKATTTSIPFPAIISIVLQIMGKPQVLKIGLYMYALSFIILSARHIIAAKKKVVVENLLHGTTEEKEVDKYPALHIYAKGTAFLSIGITLILLFVPPLNTPFRELVNGTPTPTPTVTSTVTYTPTLTPTSTLLPTATPKEQGFFYMIVLDASLKMQEAFETQTKWDAALKAVDALLTGFEDGANYGLVVIGGSPAAETSDPCSTASLGTLPFTTKAVVQGQVSQLQPRSGGSLYQAFVTAKSQFDHLPENTIRTLVYITGSEDACDSEDEWANLERYFRAKGDDGLNIYSEIIIIDSKDGLKTQSIADRISSISTKVNAQAPQTFFQLIQTNKTVITNINNYINITISSLPTNTPTITLTPSNTPTLRPGETYVPPPTNTPSFTPTFTATLTASLVPSLTPFVCPAFSHPYLGGGSLGGSVSIDTQGDCTIGYPLEFPIYTSGSLSNLPPDTVIWELVYAPDGLYYPQSPNACGDHRPPDINGNTWQVNTYMGSANDPFPQWYEMVAVVADQAASAALSQWFIDHCPGFPGIAPASLQQLNITEKWSIRVQTKPNQ